MYKVDLSYFRMAISISRTRSVLSGFLGELGFLVRTEAVIVEVVVVIRIRKNVA